MGPTELERLLHELREHVRDNNRLIKEVIEAEAKIRARQTDAQRKVNEALAAIQNYYEKGGA